MSKITPYLWFDNEAVEAAGFYAETFPASRAIGTSKVYDTPAGDCDVVYFELCGQPFTAISGGPAFRFTPAVSFLVSCTSTQEVDAIWDRLSGEGTPLMELGSYPFSDRFGWVQDRYGLSWQLMLQPGQPEPQVIPSLLFVGDRCGKAEEAINHYTAVFDDGGIDSVMRYGDDEAPERPGTVKHASFTLAGQRFAAMDSAQEHNFGFNEAISFLVNCGSQEEIDYYWDRLSAVPEAEQCGWLKDRFGLSWQVVPAELETMMREGSREQIDRITQAFLPMKRFDLNKLRTAYEDSSAKV